MCSSGVIVAQFPELCSSLPSAGAVIVVVMISHGLALNKPLHHLNFLKPQYN